MHVGLLTLPQPHSVTNQLPLLKPAPLLCCNPHHHAQTRQGPVQHNACSSQAGAASAAPEQGGTWSCIDSNPVMHQHTPERAEQTEQTDSLHSAFRGPLVMSSTEEQQHRSTVCERQKLVADTHTPGYTAYAIRARHHQYACAHCMLTQPLLPATSRA